MKTMDRKTLKKIIALRREMKAVIEMKKNHTLHVHAFTHSKKKKQIHYLSHLHLFTANNNNYNYRNVKHSDLM